MVFSQHFFPFGTTLFSSRTDNFQCYFHVSNLIQTFETDWVESLTQYSLVIHNFCYIDYPVSCHHYCKSVLSQLSSLIMTYFILGFKSFSSTFLVAMSANCRPPSHQLIFFILHFSPFITKCTLIAICLVWLLSLPLLSIQSVDLLSNISRVYYSGTIYGYLFNNSWIDILKCVKSIPTVNSELYSLSTLYWGTGTETCVTWSIGPPW